MTGPSTDLIDQLVPPAPPAPDQASKADARPKRPTTRAERKAQTEANKAARAAGGKDARPKASKGTPAPRKATLETRITDQIVGIGTIVAGIGAATGSTAVQLDGVLVIGHSANLSAALDQVAKNDPRVGRALERVLTVGTYGALIGATLPLALGIMANHGVVPPELAAQLGVELPQVPEPAPPAGGGVY